MKKLIVFLFFLFLCPVVYGQLSLADIQWQREIPSQGPKKKYVRIAEWRQPPYRKSSGHVRAMVTLRNEGSGPVAGVLLRYALYSRLAPVSRGETPVVGEWGVPLWVYEERVPKIGPKQDKRVILREMQTGVFLKKISQEGLWPDAYKLQISVWPKKGSDRAKLILESEIPVVWSE